MNIDANTKCYTFKHIEFESGILDKTVDCTYVIHLENNGRLTHIYDEINKTKPTRNVFIVFNKGFKKCEKQLIEQASYQDLTDAFLQCFKHAKENGYKNILILEDDFIFNEEIKQKSHIENIHHFLESNKNTEFVYHLGLIPIIAYPYGDFYNYRSIKSLTMHSAIYSEKCIANFRKLKLEYKHWDTIIEKSVKNRFFYYKPLCYQTFPETENKKSWHEKDGNLYFTKIKHGIIHSLNLNDKPEPGFSILYLFSNFLFFLFLILFFSIFYSLYSFIFSKKGKSFLYFSRSTKK
jgi:GR25 family glycosyltransferase involved in LPS biosynthesis